MEKEADVVIIGGGISGCAAAYYLAKGNAKVVLVEKGEIAGEASGRNTGGVRVQARTPVEFPYMVESRKLWESLERELRADVGFVAGGNLLYVEREEDIAELERAAHIGQEEGIDSRMITPAEVQNLVPGLEAPLKGALYSARDGHADPTRSTTAFATAAQEMGAYLHTNCAALKIETSNGRVASVITDQGRIDTPWIVNAAGVWANYVARMVGLHFPVRVIRMTLGMTEPVQTTVKPFVRGPNVGFRQTPEGNIVFSQGYAQPRDYDLGRELLDDIRTWLPHLIKHRKLVRFNLGWELVRSFQARTPLFSRITRPSNFRSDIEPKSNSKSLRKGLEALTQVMPPLRGVSVARSWAGLIDITPDMLPVLGSVPKLEGYILAAGFSGHGFAMGPMTGKLISELILDGKPSLSLDAFRPTRFAEGVKIRPPRNFVG